MIIFYSNHCPKCNILEKKLKSSGIEYTEINDIKFMLDKGIASVPMFEINGEMFTFPEAIEWLNKQEG